MREPNCIDWIKVGVGIIWIESMHTLSRRDLINGGAKSNGSDQSRK